MSPNNYGRAYASMFHRSMSGKGPLVISVWTYSFSHAYPAVEPDLGTVGHVELNPKIMAVLIGGCTPKEVSDVIEFLCSPDEESESKKEDGRRLVRLSQFKYRVVNFMEYRDKVSDSPEAAAKRERQERYIENKKKALAEKSSETPTNSTAASVSVVIPEPLNTPEFTAEWNNWVAYRRAKGKVKDWTDLFRRQLDHLATFSVPQALEAIKTSMRQGWTGVFPEKLNGSHSPQLRGGKMIKEGEKF